MKIYLILFLIAFKAQAYKPITEEQLQELVSSYQYDPDARFIKKPRAACSAQDMEYTTQYPQRESALNIKAKAFIPALATGQASAPLVFMLPPLGGSNSMDINLAEAFCRKKIAAIIITSDLTGLDSETLVPVSDHDQTSRRVTAAIRGALKLAGTMPEININKTGIFGASLGGILGSMAFSVIPEISAATFLVNGGDVPHILAYSDQPRVIGLKNKRKKEQNISTDADYEKYLNENMNIDPMHFVRLIQPETVKLYLSRSDNSVPSEKQMLYYEAIGKPENTKFYNMGHIPTIVNIMGLSGEKNRIVDWFDARFKLDNPRLKP